LIYRIKRYDELETASAQRGEILVETMV
jgi:hypothetical protein